jgi:hypothetical protein
MRPKEISSSRKKIAGYGAAGLMLAGTFVPVTLQSVGERKLRFLFVIGMLGLFAALAAWRLVRPPRLLLDAEGFTLVGSLERSPKKIGWSDIDPFFLHYIGEHSEAVCFNYRPGVLEASPLPSQQRRAWEALPGGWELSPKELVNVLNDYRTEALRPARAAGADI